VLGGVLTTVASWRLVFAVNVPVGLHLALAVSGAAFLAGAVTTLAAVDRSRAPGGQRGPGRRTPALRDGQLSGPERLAGRAAGHGR